MISLADVATARVMSRCSKSPPADSPLLQHWPDVETMERACGINWNNVFSCFFKWQTTRGAPNNVVVGTKQKNVANHCRPPRPPDQPSNGTIITAGFVDLSDGWLACYQLINTLKPRPSLLKDGSKSPWSVCVLASDVPKTVITHTSRSTSDVSIDSNKFCESAKMRAKHR